MITRDFLGDSMLSKDDVFMSTNFWPELRETTDPYTRWDLSMKQDLPLKGLQLFLNINNITESIDVNRYRIQFLWGQFKI